MTICYNSFSSDMICYNDNSEFKDSKCRMEIKWLHNMSNIQTDCE